MTKEEQKILIRMLTSVMRVLNDEREACALQVERMLVYDSEGLSVDRQTLRNIATEIRNGKYQP